MSETISVESKKSVPSLFNDDKWGNRILGAALKKTVEKKKRLTNELLRRETLKFKDDGKAERLDMYTKIITALDNRAFDNLPESSAPKEKHVMHDALMGSTPSVAQGFGIYDERDILVEEAIKILIEISREEKNLNGAYRLMAKKGKVEEAEEPPLEKSGKNLKKFMELLDRIDMVVAGGGEKEKADIQKAA